MAPGKRSSQRGDPMAQTPHDEGGGLALLGGLVALGTVIQTAAWMWGHPLAAATALTGAAVVLLGLRQALRRTSLGLLLRRHLHPLWALVREGISARLVRARTTLTAAVTDRIEQWAHEPLRRDAPAEPAASYVRRPHDHTLEAFQAATPVRFEEMCRELLERDGFANAKRVGGAGDLGADVVADDHLGRRVVLQCKRYANAVGSEAVQKFNGTARPVHAAAVPVVVALNGFTDPAADFANQQGLHLVDRERLARWGAGRHLYDVLEIERGPERRT